MQVVKATKLFRQVSILVSLVMALVSVCLLCIGNIPDCTNGQLKVTTGLVFGLWSTVFVLLLLQVAGLTKCLKKVPRILFAFYFFVCGVMFFTQLMLWGGEDNNCMQEAAVLYWWLFANVVVFYLVVSFGLATWGSYICKVADAQEEFIAKARNEYDKNKGDMPERHFQIAAGPKNQPLLLENGQKAEPTMQRMVLTGNNPYAQQEHDQATMN